jgi:hypothetical protein
MGEIAKFRMAYVLLDPTRTSCSVLRLRPHSELPHALTPRVSSKRLGSGLLILHGRRGVHRGLAKNSALLMDVQRRGPRIPALGGIVQRRFFYCVLKERAKCCSNLTKIFEICSVRTTGSNFIAYGTTPVRKWLDETFR